MDGSELVDAVREAEATSLDRLGSEKALVALTEARLETEVVLTAVAEELLRAHDTFEALAADADGAAAAALSDAAERQTAHYEAVADRLDDPPAEAAADAVHEHLRGLDAAPARVGGALVGWPLVTARTYLQVINFFVNEADRATADAFRDVRSDTEALAGDGADVLDTVCEDEDDWTAAREAATATVRVAYDDYAAAMEAMGLDPKPVC